MAQGREFLDSEQASQVEGSNPGVNGDITQGHTRAIGEGPCNFEPWSSNDTRTLPTLLQTTTTRQREDFELPDLTWISLSTQRVFSGTRTGSPDMPVTSLLP
ncbi:hypothetical protein TNCV_1105201 [Trichonephila clavipes]|nr:hypothetical protein TNCV_1105201 [Trichonephila clavipes]